MATTNPTNPLYTGISVYQDSQISNITSSVSTVAGSVSALAIKQDEDKVALYANSNANKNFVMDRIADEATERTAQDNLLKGRLNIVEPIVSSHTESIATVSASLQSQITKEASDVSQLYANSEANKNFLMARIGDEAGDRSTQDNLLKARLNLVEPLVASHSASIADLSSGLSQAVAKEMTDYLALGAVDVLIKTEVNKIIVTDNFQSTLLSQTASKSDVYNISGAVYNFLQIFLQTYQIKNAQNEVLTINQLWNPSISMPNAPTYNPTPFPEVNPAPPTGLGFM
jgi:hypothetical protein